MTGVLAGLALAAGLHTIAGLGATPGVAASFQNSTQTSSTTSSTSVESPPVCELGTSRQVETPTTQLTVGPGCIGIGNRDIANSTPDCGGLPPALPPSDPSHGTVFLVPFGTSNLNLNIHTETVQCVAPVPALPLPLLLGLGGALAGLGAWGARRGRRGRR